MPNSQNSSAAKQAAGKAAAYLITQGMVVGLGTGSTAAFFIEELGRRVKEGLKIKAIASSRASYQLAKAHGIPLIDLNDVLTVDVTVDGADEIDPQKQMIKGAGGALLCEKILASSSNEMIVVADESKLVKSLGHTPLPVEVAIYGFKATILKLERQGFLSLLRMASSEKPFVTDMGNYIVDSILPLPILNLEETNQKIMDIPGVIDTGFFFNVAGRVIVGQRDGTTRVW